MRGPGTRPDKLRGLESVHAGHINVEQDHRAIVLEQPAQRILPRPLGDDFLIQSLENGGEYQQLVIPIVNDQYVRAGTARDCGILRGGFAPGIIGLHDAAEIGHWC